VIDASGIRATLQPLAIAALLAAVGGSLVVSPGPDGLFGALLAALMIAIAAEDFRRFIIPNELTAAAVALGLLRAGTVGPDADWTAMLQAALRAMAITLPLLALMIGYRRWRGRDGLGLGDVKLAAVAGIWLGLASIFAVIEVAALAALGAYFIASTLRKRPLKATAFLPFGVFLAPAIWIGWLVEAIFGQIAPTW
jgi:leader peptidase (prepilin peptidase)/N-methyltransferase